MVEYKETFLSKIKSLLLYFVEFSDNRFILSKVYLDDCEARRSDQRPIIMITNDESTVSANSSCQRV